MRIYSKENLRVLLCSTLNKAKNSILLSSYGLSDPYVIDILNAKAKHGTQVTILTDASFAKGIKKNFPKKSL